MKELARANFYDKAIENGTATKAGAPKKPVRPGRAIPKEVPQYMPEGYRHDIVDYTQLKEADPSWNFFSSPSESKISDLALSIEKNGLMQPIVVREIEPVIVDGTERRYEILAGHTRTAAFKMLHKASKDNKFQYIQAIIYDKDVLDDYQAKEIIVDTNFFNRGNLPPSDMAKCIRYKAELIKKGSSYGSGSVADKIAEQYDMSKTSVKQWQGIARLNDETLALFDERKISLKNAYKLSVLSEEAQAILRERCKETLSNKAIESVDFTDLNDIEKIVEAINGYRTPKGIITYTKTYDKKQLNRKKGELQLVFINKDKLEEVKKYLEKNNLGFIVE